MFNSVKINDMREHAVRLIKGCDLLEEIERIANDNNYNTLVVLSAVGSVSNIKIRLAKAIEYLELNQDFEIVSLMGTVSCGGAHLHVSFSDEKGNVIGGHLCKGTIINTTCELVFGILEDYESKRAFDESTNYNEIVFRKKDSK